MNGMHKRPVLRGNVKSAVLLRHFGGCYLYFIDKSMLLQLVKMLIFYKSSFFL